eukprot:9706223-Alexandrium_andersonii.AAC.1
MQLAALALCGACPRMRSGGGGALWSTPAQDVAFPAWCDCRDIGASPGLGCSHPASVGVRS